MLTHFETVLAEKKLLAGNNIYLFNFKLISPSEIDFLAGQYLMLKVPTVKGFVSRMYSIASQPPLKDNFELIVEIIPHGLASTLLDKLNAGQGASFWGPEGAFAVKDKEKQKIILATVTGIAPIRSMLKDGMTNYHLFWGLRNYKDVYLFEELKPFNPKICLSREENLETVSEGDRNYFDLGHVDEVMNKLIIDGLTGYEFYLCGGKATVESLKQGLLAKNITQENIHIERF